MSAPATMPRHVRKAVATPEKRGQRPQHAPQQPLRGKSGGGAGGAPAGIAGEEAVIVDAV
jgi:hypothetical protein